MAVIREESTLDSTYKNKKLHLVVWKDDAAAPKAVVQLSHGMCEYVKRYEEMAEAMVEAGYAVCGNDHLGHGETAADSEELGFIADKDGFRFMVKDLRKVTEYITDRFPGVPVILYGHSMGSFLARKYAADYQDGIAIMGARWGSKFLLAETVIAAQEGRLTEYADEIAKYYEPIFDAPEFTLDNDEDWQTTIDDMLRDDDDEYPEDSLSDNDSKWDAWA